MVVGVAPQDPAIPPDAERLFARRMGATTIEIPPGTLPARFMAATFYIASLPFQDALQNGGSGVWPGGASATFGSQSKGRGTPGQIRRDRPSALEERVRGWLAELMIWS